ncbi:MAG: hypothetical protein FWC22_08525 [Treponema sp.]|nr:hypothetical protein [Treponema sp.]
MDLGMLNFRMIAKFALILVIIGFLMPVACGMNGFEIADALMNNNSVFQGILAYLLFISAVAGVALGVMLFLKKDYAFYYDWIVIGVCIVSGLIVYFASLSDNNIKLQNGAYVILAGWIISLGCQIYSYIKKE